jgi:hypothetical protein
MSRIENTLDKKKRRKKNAGISTSKRKDELLPYCSMNRSSIGQTPSASSKTNGMSPTDICCSEVPLALHAKLDGDAR